MVPAGDGVGILVIKLFVVICAVMDVSDFEAELVFAAALVDIASAWFDAVMRMVDEVDICCASVEVDCNEELVTPATDGAAAVFARKIIHL